MTDDQLFADYYTEEQVAKLLDISVKRLRNRHCEGKNHPPRTPERRYPKKEFHDWNRKRLQYQLNKAS